MNEHLQTTTGALGQRYGAELSEFRGQYTLAIPAGRIVDVCRDLRDEFGFEMLAGSTAVDYWPEQEPRFHMVYMLHSLKHNVRLSLRVVEQRLNGERCLFNAGRRARPGPPAAVGVLIRSQPR